MPRSDLKPTHRPNNFPRERREHKVFLALLKSIPGLEDKLMNAASEDEVHGIATIVSFAAMIGDICLIYFQIQKGASSARSDDTKSLKSAIIDWLVPLGEPLVPPITRNVKIERGFNHNVTGALLCPTGVDWSDCG